VTRQGAFQDNKQENRSFEGNVFPRFRDPLGVMHAKEKSAKSAQGDRGGDASG